MEWRLVILLVALAGVSKATLPVSGQCSSCGNDCSSIWTQLTADQLDGWNIKLVGDPLNPPQVPTNALKLSSEKVFLGDATPLVMTYDDFICVRLVRFDVSCADSVEVRLMDANSDGDKDVLVASGPLAGSSGWKAMELPIGPCCVNRIKIRVWPSNSTDCEPQPLTAIRHVGVEFCDQGCIPDDVSFDTNNAPEDGPSWAELSAQMMVDFRQLTRPELTHRQQHWLDNLASKQTDAEDGLTGTGQRLMSAAATPLCVRKEYRTLSSAERKQYHDTVLAMASTYPDPNDTRSEYQVFVHWHESKEAPAAHQGPGFLPWHREYLLRYEKALQAHNPNVCLPYWDSHLDQLLPVPGHSVMWSSAEFGNNNGTVITGPYRNFKLLPECEKYAVNKGKTLSRFFASTNRSKNSLPTASKLQWFTQKKYFSNLTCITVGSPSGCYFENSIHGSVHICFYPGVMAYVFCSPSDPIFFLHHCFMDLLWEEFRQNYQVTDVETEYPGPPTYSSIPKEHQWNATMLPFKPKINIQGLSNSYTTTYYSYTQRPSAVNCKADVDCGNADLLWCNTSTKKCTSKVRIGGICTGLANNACANQCTAPKSPVCYLGTCSCV